MIVNGFISDDISGKQDRDNSNGAKDTRREGNGICPQEKAKTLGIRSPHFMLKSSCRVPSVANVA